MFNHTIKFLMKHLKLQNKLFFIKDKKCYVGANFWSWTCKLSFHTNKFTQFYERKGGPGPVLLQFSLQFYYLSERHINLHKKLSCISSSSKSNQIVEQLEFFFIVTVNLTRKSKKYFLWLICFIGIRATWLMTIVTIILDERILHCLELSRRLKRRRQVGQRHLYRNNA